MGEGDNGREVAMRVVVALIEMSEQRAQLIPHLSAVVRQVVEELDPDHERNTEPTWWQDLPVWQTLDSFDRLRRAHDQLLVLEVQAHEIVGDLKGMFALAAVGSPARPYGYTPARAHAELMRMALRRGEMLGDMAKAERLLRPRLKPATSKGLRAEIRVVIAQESEAQETRQRLLELLIPPTDLRQSV